MHFTRCFGHTGVMAKLVHLHEEGFCGRRQFSPLLGSWLTLPFSHNLEAPRISASGTCSQSMLTPAEQSLVPSRATVTDFQASTVPRYLPHSHLLLLLQAQKSGGGKVKSDWFSFYSEVARNSLSSLCWSNSCLEPWGTARALPPAGSL